MEDGVTMKDYRLGLLSTMFEFAPCEYRAEENHLGSRWNTL